MRRLPFTLGSRRLNFFKPAAGLGNCLIPMGNVLHLAAELNYRPVVFWISDSSAGGASFGDLFETANLPFELVEGLEASITRSVLTKGSRLNLNPLERMGFRLLSLPIRFQYRKGVRLPVGTNAEIAKFMARPTLNLGTGRGYLVLTNKYFRHGCDLSWLKPSSQLASQIIELKKRFAPNTVGVHLRGTDLRRGTERIDKKYPPVEKIIARMHAEVELNPDVKFFFASDGEKREEEIVTLFEERLIRPPKRAPRKTVEGQQDAVVDLFGLAATSRIIGTKRSSFATLAALMGNKPLLRLTPLL